MQTGVDATVARFSRRHPAVRPTAACVRSMPPARPSERSRPSTSTRSTSSRRRSSATTSSRRPTTKSPTRSRSTPAACSRRTPSTRSSRRRARSAAPCTINLNNPFLPTALRNQFCAFNVAPNVNGVDADGRSRFRARSPTRRASPRPSATLRPLRPAQAIRTTARHRRPQPSRGRERSAYQRLYQATVFDYRIGAAVRDHRLDRLGRRTVRTASPSKIQTIKNYTLQSRFRQGALVNGTAGQPGLPEHRQRLRSGQPVRHCGHRSAPKRRSSSARTAPRSVRTSLAQARGMHLGRPRLHVARCREPIGFALGAEYRKYRAQQASDTPRQDAG